MAAARKTMVIGNSCWSRALSNGLTMMTIVAGRDQGLTVRSALPLECKSV